MNFSSLRQKTLEYVLTLKHAKAVYIVTVVFALLYHSAFLIVFKNLNVLPMFYFNIGSVTLFLTLTLIFPLTKDCIRPYFFAFLEVVTHQLLADRFLGGNASFHFFILLVGVLPILVFGKHMVAAIVFQIITAFAFIFLEVIAPDIKPIYLIDEKILRLIKITNISLSVFVIILILLLFTIILYTIQSHLEVEVSEKAEEVKIESEKRISLQNHIIISLASLVENRDTDTGEHIQRTSAYVELLSRKAYEHGVYPETITPEFIELIKRAAPMHDIGKIVVMDNVLKKPGKLTPEEFEQMKRHTTEGERIINEVIGVSEDKEFIRMASEVACSHHERWDGKGYPHGLKGEEIPLSARIMAIADVFDALVSPRCYKEPMSQKEAFRIIQEEAGSHFDPILAELFIDSRFETEEVLKKYGN